jgi:ketosteroid isomerase-like protein
VEEVEEIVVDGDLANGATQAMEQTMSTRDVFEHNFQAFQDQDMGEIMADYSEESVVVTADGTSKGLDEISDMFAAFFYEFSGEYFVEPQEEVVEGDVAFFTWKADTPETFYEFGTDTVIVIGDVIRDQTVAAVANEK